MDDLNMSDDDVHFNSETQKEYAQKSYYSVLTGNAMKENESSKSKCDIHEDDLIEALLSNVTKRDALISKSFMSIDTSTPPTPGICRICFQPDSIDTDRCITPCHCRGTMSKVHRGCLEKWLSRSKTTCCEICTFKYKIIKMRKYSLLGSVKAWWCSYKSQEDSNEIIFDTLLLFVLMPMMISVTYVGFLITDQILTTDHRQIDYSEPLYQIISFGVFTTTVCVDFVVFSWVTCRLMHYVTSWFNFYMDSQEVTVIDEECETDS